MREILFRGKRIDNGEWVFGSFCMDALEQYNGLCGVDGFIRLYDKTEGKMLTHEVDRDTVGQYTGLTDKNGKRIFEGDIVKDASIGMLGDVVFSTVCVPSFAINDVCDGLQYHDGFWHDLEVIGNIHDNPELLKEG